MQIINKPIDVISWCNVLGQIIPLKVRIESPDYSLTTLKILEVLYANENLYAGERMIDFGCKLQLEEREQVWELRYIVSSHKWLLRKNIY